MDVAGSDANNLDAFASEIVRRFEIARLGRKAHPFGAAVHVSRGIVTRLQSGNLPGAEFLAPLAQIERLSLSWLMTGDGARYVVSSVASDADAWRLLRDRLGNDPDGCQIDVAVSDAGWTVVLHEQRVSETRSGEIYSWRATEVIGGSACGAVVARGLEQWAKIKPMHALKFSGRDFRRLITGKLGNAELWGAKDVDQVAQREPIVNLRDHLPDYQGLSAEGPIGSGNDEERAILDLFRSLTSDDKGVVLRMLGGLARPQL